MSILEAAKTLKKHCDSLGDSCKGCVFHDEECIMYAELPCDWKIPEQEPISKDIQHVGYSQEACGYEK